MGSDICVKFCWSFTKESFAYSLSLCLMVVHWCLLSQFVDGSREFTETFLTIKITKRKKIPSSVKTFEPSQAMELQCRAKKEKEVHPG